MPESRWRWKFWAVITVVAKELSAFLKGPASGLDSQGHDAVASLINEFKGGRRDFVHDLVNVSLGLKGGE